MEKINRCQNPINQSYDWCWVTLSVPLAKQQPAATGIEVYFCAPHSPWQLGSNENMNGLVRQFLPKGMDLSTMTPQALAYIESALTDCALKVLGFRTLRVVYNELVEKIQAKIPIHVLHFSLDTAPSILNLERHEFL